MTIITPSLIITSIINEGWGLDLTNNAQHRQWLKEMYDYVKALDPTRLVVDNSNGPLHVKTDINDAHFYFNIPDHYKEYQEWINQLANHPAWNWSGDAQKTDQEPLVISEFGNWGLPSVEALCVAYKNEEPWWFKTGGPNSIRPQGVRQRFKDWGLNKAFRSYEELSIASQLQEFEALKSEIEQIRKYKSIVGYVITEFMDLHWECNGLLDFCRNHKAFHNQMAMLQAQDVIITHWQRLNYCSGDNFQATVLVSHFSDLKIQHATLQWELEGFKTKGTIKNIHIETTDVKQVGEIKFKVPPVNKARKTKLNLRLKTPNGNLIAKNYLQINLFPQVYPKNLSKFKIWLHDPKNQLTNLASKLKAAGYQVCAQPEPDINLAITNSLDKSLIDYLNQGGRLLLLATQAHSIPFPFATIKVVDRSSKGRWGDWCSSFSYIDPHLLKGIPTKTHFCGFEFYQIIPHTVLEGFELPDASDILSAFSSAG